MRLEHLQSEGTTHASVTLHYLSGPTGHAVVGTMVWRTAACSSMKSQSICVSRSSPQSTSPAAMVVQNNLQPLQQTAMRNIQQEGLVSCCFPLDLSQGQLILPCQLGSPVLVAKQSTLNSTRTTVCWRPVWA